MIFLPISVLSHGLRNIHCLLRFPFPDSLLLFSLLREVKHEYRQEKSPAQHRCKGQLKIKQTSAQLCPDFSGQHVVQDQLSHPKYMGIGDRYLIYHTAKVFNTGAIIPSFTL